MHHRQVDIGDPLLASDLREVEGEDEVDVVGSPAHQEFYNYYYYNHFYHYYYHYNVVGGPAHHEDRHHHPEHLHLVEENTENRKKMSHLIEGLGSY